MNTPGIDADQIGHFARVMFQHAEEGGTVAVRAFFDDGQAKKKGSPPFKIVRALINGAGLDPVIAAVVELAKEAAVASRPVVVCPPLVTFSGTRATEVDVKEGLGLAIECDSNPDHTLRTLRAILGPPTFVIASGGEWTDPATGQVLPRLHAHWRLKEPTTSPAEHAKLKRARKLACEVVVADGSAVPLVHPMRWPGTLHCKAKPRLAQIVEANDEAEINLDHALAELEGLLALRGRHSNAKPNGDARRAAGGGELDAELLAEAGRLIGNAELPWDEWNRIGMALWGASAGSEAGFEAFEAVSRKSAKYDPAATQARWDHYRTSPPDRLGAGTVVFLARQSDRSFARQNRRPEREETAEQDDVLVKLHRKYFVVVRAGRVTIAYEEEDPALKRRAIQFMTADGLKLLYAPHLVQKGIKADGTPNLKSVAAVWMQSPQRRTYERMAFLPSEKADADTFNLWRGWGVAPTEGDWPLIREHLAEVVCSGDTARYNYLLGWMAFCVQHPAKRPEVAVVLRGGEGAGKAAGIAPLARIFRHHYLHLTDPRHLTGHFNAHMLDACLVFADETFCAGDRKAAARLRALITEELNLIEPKGVDPFLAPNLVKLIMASNEEWVVPAAADARRYAVFDVSKRRVGDRQYFRRLWAAIEDAETPALLHHLLTMNLGGFEPRDFPRTAALDEQKLRSADVVAKWLYACLTGHLLISWNELTPKERVRDSILLYARERSIRDRDTPDEATITKRLLELSGQKRGDDGEITQEACGFLPTRRRLEGRLSQLFKLGTVEQHRAAFLEAMGMDQTHDWGDAPEVEGE